jgi:hypothetical protein
MVDAHSSASGPPPRWLEERIRITPDGQPPDGGASDDRPKDA